jgi:hypothetical protein
MSHSMKIRSIFQKCGQVCDFLHETLGVELVQINKFH